MSLTLTRAELTALTGYVRAREQVAWVREHYGINAHLNAANEPIVVRAHLESAVKPVQNATSIKRVRTVV